MSNNWIDDALLECEDVEVPRSFIYWPLLAAISAAAGNNYYVATRAKYSIRPNLYIILLGESGLGKGFGINLSKILCQKADITRVIAGQSTIQGIVQELSNVTSREKKEPLKDSRAYIVSGELAASIISDELALTTLTDLYDGHYNPTWNKLLKSGKEGLKEPCITFCAGSSPSHFYKAIPDVNIEGGFMGRTLMVYEEKRYKDTDLLSDDEMPGFPHDKFTPHLEWINNHAGRMIPDNEAKILYNTWRRQWREGQKPDKTGFNNRVPDHVLKVAMCLCLSKYNTALVISREDIQEAIDRVVELAYSSKRATDGVGLDPLSKQTRMVLDFLLKEENNTLKRRQLLSKGYGNYDSASLDTILSNLEELGWINKTRHVAGSQSDWIITLGGEQRDAYERFIDSRKDKIV